MASDVQDKPGSRDKTPELKIQISSLEGKEVLFFNGTYAII